MVLQIRWFLRHFIPGHLLTRQRPHHTHYLDCHNYFERWTTGHRSCVGGSLSGVPSPEWACTVAVATINYYTGCFARKSADQFKYMSFKAQGWADAVTCLDVVDLGAFPS